MSWPWESVLVSVKKSSPWTIDCLIKRSKRSNRLLPLMPAVDNVGKILPVIPSSVSSKTTFLLKQLYKFFLTDIKKQNNQSERPKIGFELYLGNNRVMKIWTILKNANYSCNQICNDIKIVCNIFLAWYPTVERLRWQRWVVIYGN